MSEEGRSVRSLPDMGTSSPQISPMFLRTSDQQDVGRTISRPRSTYDSPNRQTNDLSPRKPIFHTSNPPTYSDEPGPSSSGSRFRPPRTDFTQSSMAQIGPPPLAPYVTADRRYYAPRPPSRQWLGPDGRRSAPQDRPIFPPPPKPPPPHIVASSSNSNRMQPFTKLDDLRLPPFTNRSYSHSPETSISQPQPLPSRPSTHSSQFPSFLSPRSPHISARDQHDVHSSHRLPPIYPTSESSSQRMYHDEVHARNHLDDSPHSRHSYAMYRELSGESSISGSSQTGTSSMQSGQLYPLGSYKKKRTRALMTNMQQSGLSRLWRKTKFPTGTDREKLGQEIGLTSRQVQVWFQNQRQKGRKALMVNGGIPEGEDPADYEDLQNSPRSRRLSVDEDERISAWAGSSASSASTRLLLDPPSSAGSNYHEPMSSVHHPHHHSRPYRDEIPPRSAIPLRSPSPYERWDHERGGPRDLDGKLGDEQYHSEYRQRHHRRSHSLSQSQEYAQSQHHAQSHHGYSRTTTYPPHISSSLQLQQSSSSAAPSGRPSSRGSVKWDRPFPSVLEPITRSPHSSIPLSAPLPPTTLSPLSTSSSSRPDTQQTQSWIPLPIKRRRSSPSIIPDSIKLAYPGNIDHSKANEVNMRYSRSRSHSGEEQHHSPNSSPHIPQKSISQPHSHSYLPPELARIALSGPLEKRYRREESSEDFSLPGIGEPGSMSTHSVRTRRESSIQYEGGGSKEPTFSEREKDDSKYISNEDEGAGSGNHDTGKGKAKEREIEGSMNWRENKIPTSSNLRNLLD